MAPADLKTYLNSPLTIIYEKYELEFRGIMQRVKGYSFVAINN